MIDENILEKLAKCAYESYAGVTNATSEDYYALDILPYDKLSTRSKKHWIDVARVVVLASWNMNVEDLK
jgi:hypothetical protein